MPCSALLLQPPVCRRGDLSFFTHHKLINRRPQVASARRCAANSPPLTLARDSLMRAPTGVKHASLYDENNRQQQLGPSGVETYFVNKQGLKIATYFWPSSTPASTKAVVLLVHGHGAHTQIEYLRRQVQNCLSAVASTHLQALISK